MKKREEDKPADGLVRRYVEETGYAFGKPPLKMPKHPPRSGTMLSNTFLDKTTGHGASRPSLARRRAGGRSQSDAADLHGASRARAAMKTHLRDGSCKRGERGLQASHRRFVEAENEACLTCARTCGCAECHDLQLAWGTLRGRDIEGTHVSRRD